MTRFSQRWGDLFPSLCNVGRGAGSFDEVQVSATPFVFSIFHVFALEPSKAPSAVGGGSILAGEGHCRGHVRFPGGCFTPVCS